MTTQHHIEGVPLTVQTFNGLPALTVLAGWPAGEITDTSTQAIVHYCRETLRQLMPSCRIVVSVDDGILRGQRDMADLVSRAIRAHVAS